MPPKMTTGVPSAQPASLVAARICGHDALAPTATLRTRE
jgi:hypothetical protein